jgi:hypothetical protein
MNLFRQPASDYKPFPALRQSCSDVAIGKKAAESRAINDRHPLLSDVLEIISSIFLKPKITIAVLARK